MKMFWFGRNWKNYVKHVVTEKTLEEAKESLFKYVPQDISKDEFYRNKVFIDFGCGSGTFSLGALLTGCKKVISFDIQNESLEVTEMLKDKFKYLLNKLDHEYSWEIFRGDILDDGLAETLSAFGDIVYSWGVLHHTGSMYKAIENACKLVKPGGFLIIAIYNHAPSSESWLKIKRFFNSHPPLQPFLALLYGVFVCSAYIIRRKTFNLYKDMGMHVFYDAIDWIGGYPYEYACYEEIQKFVENLGFTLVKSPTKLPCGKDSAETNPVKRFFQIIRAANTGCNEFVLKKT
ncbi:MAG: methyltransferase domain-containing protein [Geminocystis sp.]|nr:methyltransferase domain-containing protein [Geminocystis sp.]